jgi:hypothetical protein
MSKRKTPFLILSAERPDWLRDSNKVRTDTLRGQLEARELAFREVEGCYDGKCEASFLVLAPTAELGKEYRLVLQLARRYGQEAVLLVDANRMAHLVRIHGNHEHVELLGHWEQIDSESVHLEQAYTRDPDTSYCYGVR